jgi:hypothetical protein
MKVFLLHRDRDLEVRPELRDAMFDAMLSGNLFSIINVRRDRERAGGAESAESVPEAYHALTQDLELNTLWLAMAKEDEFLFEMAKMTVLSSLDDLDAITYRQQVLADCLAQPDVVRALYALAMQALENERSAGGFWHTDRPGTIIRRSVQVLTAQVEVLRQLRTVAEEDGERFRSDGFRRFFSMLRSELAEDYIATVEQQLGELQFKRGVLESVRLGTGLKGRDYVVRRQRERHWTERLPFSERAPSHSFSIAPRDEAGFRQLQEIVDHGTNVVADAVGRSADHVKSFFTMLRLELAFYLGCLNLHDQLEAKDEPTCFPTPVAAGSQRLSAEGVYDVCLTLHVEDRVVGNALRADGKSLVVITGANQGGKSTLLRSVGLAHLMMQCGMFVGAQSFEASVCAGVCTHYKREEDATMRSGKLDEELRRMSEIADRIAPDAILLCNESFASTNEREGSAIARDVVRAMLDRRIRVVFVTHMYELAHGFHAEQLDSALFLRAERQEDGRRTFKLLEGEPLPTSYGRDSYQRIFDDARAEEQRAVTLARDRSEVGDR